MSHTPGPWHHDDRILWGCVTSKPMGQGWTIAMVPRRADESASVPDARLIAAAPDLLEALEASATGKTSSGPCWCGMKDSTERAGVPHLPSCQRARAALRKARGQ